MGSEPSGGDADPASRSISDLISLGGRRAVVTGAAQGIGLAVATPQAQAGADVVVADIDGAAAESAASALAEATGRRVLPATLDVTDTATVSALADRVVDELGGLDIWVNNAGIYPASPVLDLADDEWDLVLDVNLKAVFVGAREAARRMVDSGTAGVIVNMASTAAFHAGGGGQAHYVSSKHGVNGLTKSLAVELGEHGIRVLGIAPTLVWTPGIERVRSTLPALAGSDPFERLVEGLPLRRACQPDDVARVVLFAVSDLAGLMTGSTLLVDAGRSAT